MRVADCQKGATKARFWQVACIGIYPGGKIHTAVTNGRQGSGTHDKRRAEAHLKLSKARWDSINLVRRCAGEAEPFGSSETGTGAAGMAGTDAFL